VEVRRKGNSAPNDAKDLYGISHSTLISESCYTVASKNRGDLDGLFDNLDIALSTLAQRCIVDGIGIDQCFTSSKLFPSTGFMQLSDKCLIEAFDRARLMDERGELNKLKEYLQTSRELLVIEEEFGKSFSFGFCTERGYDGSMIVNLRDFFSRTKSVTRKV